MLTKCAECEYADKKAKHSKKYRRKHTRLPNGFGQISKVKGHLRNPYRAMVTIGKSPDGKPICKILKPQGYFKTYNEAYEALIKYHKDPYVYGHELTCNELFERWAHDYFDMTTAAKGYENAWKYCSVVYNLPIADLKVAHVKDCILNGKYNGKPLSPTVRIRVNSVFRMMLDYAVENEFIEYNCARKFSMPKSVTKEVKANYKGHHSFTAEEFENILSHRELPYLELIVVQCYTGMRPGELCSILKENVDLSKNIMIGGFKTDAGRDRVIPIHPSIRGMVRNMYDSAEGEYLVDLNYSQYKVKFRNIMLQLGISGHSPHDCRKQFVTMAKSHGVDEYAIKRIVGHKIADITENIYTDRDVEWLSNEILKLPSL